MCISYNIYSEQIRDSPPMSKCIIERYMLRIVLHSFPCHFCLPHSKARQAQNLTRVLGHMAIRKEYLSAHQQHWRVNRFQILSCGDLLHVYEFIMKTILCVAGPTTCT